MPSLIDTLLVKTIGPVRLRLHPGGHRPHRVEHPVEVDGHHPAPLLGRHRVDGGRMRAHAGVGEAGVDPAESGHRFPSRPRPPRSRRRRRRRGALTGHRGRPPRVPTPRLRSWRRWCPRSRPSPRPAATRARHAEPDPAVAAGDQCHVAGQVVPGCLRRHGRQEYRPPRSCPGGEPAHDRPADEHRQPAGQHRGRAAPTGRRWPRARRTPPGRRSVRPPPRRHRRGGRRRGQVPPTMVTTVTVTKVVPPPKASTLDHSASAARVSLPHNRVRSPRAASARASARGVRRRPP